MMTSDGMRMMPRKLPPHVTSQITKGKKYFYFRKGKGARIPLPSPGTKEFEEAYQAARIGQLVPKRPTKAPVLPQSFDALIISYMRDGNFRRLRQTSKAGYISRLEAIRKQHGHRSVPGLTRECIITKIMRPYADKPGAQLSTLKMLRILIKHAIVLGWLDRDPSIGISRPKTQEIRSWTEAEIARYENKWPMETKQRLAFALHLYTGQRRSDVHRMTWADIDAGSNTISVVQQKTGAKLTMPLHRNLRAVLDHARREHVTILNTAYGKPFTVDGFSGFMRDAIRAAGLPLGCQPHGLRKAAGRRLAEAGCTAHEIMSVLGHKSLAEAERYTREADQARLANAAVSKLERQNENRIAQTVPEKFGKSGKKNGISI